MPFSISDVIIVIVVAIIMILAITYIIRAKRKGVKCIGCPNGCKCSDGQSSGCTSCANCNNK